MIYSSEAYTGSTYTRTNLTYINSLVETAYGNGQFFIMVDNVYMDDSMSDALSEVYGYTITKRFNDIGQYTTYVIAFDNPPVQTPTPTNTPTPTPTPTPAHVAGADFTIEW
jgi:hypothetical protein